MNAQEMATEGARLSKLLDDGRCALDECPRLRSAHGLCGMHYMRQKRNGDPRVVRRIRGDNPIRFWAKVERRADSECWPWTASRTASGHGMIQWGGRQQGAHRIAYTLLVGPIPDGLVIDHLCRVPACCNPRHMEPVTARENTLRGFGSPAQNARKSSCKRGHEFSTENTYWTRDGRRDCRACWAVRA